MDRLARIQPDFIGILSWGGNILERMGQRKRQRKDICVILPNLMQLLNGPDSLRISANISKATFLMLLNGKKEGNTRIQNNCGKISCSEFVKSKNQRLFTILIGLNICKMPANNLAKDRFVRSEILVSIHPLLQWTDAILQSVSSLL